jgi:hypothetical protein
VVIPLQKPNGKEGSAGELRFLQFEVQTDYSFLDYIASGYSI